ncbi:MAG: ammonium transporter, partial [Pseudanabaenaceae cyanobacterium]
IKIDDPVGATSVHLVCGIWGTIALGLFSQGNKFGANPAPKLGLFSGGGIEQMVTQLIGVVAVGAFTVAVSFIAWKIIGVITEGIRVSPEEEFEGLDIGEHGMEAYSDFMRESDLQ